MALGQASEVIFIFAIPPVLARIGMKWALLLGMAMWGVRFVLFMAAPTYGNELAVLAVCLHGICNDFFIVIAAMYIDRLAPRHLSVQAQSWLILMISGFGAAIGSTLSGDIFGKYIVSAAIQTPSIWGPMWITPIVCAAITTVVWTIFFRTKQDSANKIN
jgi:MFS family permease